jgi:hypothetical protein
LKQNFKRLFKILLIIVVLIFVYNSFFKPLPIDFDRVTKIEIQHVGGEIKHVIIQDKKSIEEINKIFSKAKGSDKYSIPACPFGLKMIFYIENKKIPLILGTDECGYVKTQGEEYFWLEEDDVIPLQKIIEKHTKTDFDNLRF